jgi:hypothetical protein
MLGRFTPGGCLGPRQADWEVHFDAVASKQQNITGSFTLHEDTTYGDTVSRQDQAGRAAKVTTPTTAGCGSARTWTSPTQNPNPHALL